MTKELKREAKAMVDREFARALEQHGLAHSKHEGYALLLEEYEEAKEAMHYVTALTHLLWDNVKNDNDMELDDTIECLYSYVLDLITEVAQVGAMVKKFKESEVLW